MMNKASAALGSFAFLLQSQLSLGAAQRKPFAFLVQVPTSRANKSVAALNELGIITRTRSSRVPAS